jgi:hypothetical protein
VCPAAETVWVGRPCRAAAPPAKPRHTRYDVEKLFATLERADPRLALAATIGAELRLGQVLRTRRSDVLPSPDGRFRIGAVRVHGRGKKLGELVILTMEERHALQRALCSGYLADLEVAHQRGEIKDFNLFPGHYLRRVHDRKGRGVMRSRVENADAPVGKTALQKWWRTLEAAAGVEHQKGRGAYGLRRLQSDRAEDVEDDARVLNILGAWKRTSTREGYQQEERVELREKAARTRRKIRPSPRGTDTGRNR